MFIWSKRNVPESILETIVPRPICLPHTTWIYYRSIARSIVDGHWDERAFFNVYTKNQIFTIHKTSHFILKQKKKHNSFEKMNELFWWVFVRDSYGKCSTGKCVEETIYFLSLQISPATFLVIRQNHKISCMRKLRIIRFYYTATKPNGFLSKDASIFDCHV